MKTVMIKRMTQLSRIRLKRPIAAVSSLRYSMAGLRISRSTFSEIQTKTRAVRG